MREAIEAKSQWAIRIGDVKRLTDSQTSELIKSRRFTLGVCNQLKAPRELEFRFETVI
jgi:hypothetical protein